MFFCTAEDRRGLFSLCAETCTTVNVYAIFAAACGHQKPFAQSCELLRQPGDRPDEGGCLGQPVTSHTSRRALAPAVTIQ